MMPADARSNSAPAGGALTTASKHRSKMPVGRLLLLAILLIAATAYQMRVAEYHHAGWFGRSQAWPPFLVSGQHISFVDPASLKAGLKEGDRLLSVNGRPLTANAVFGEELRKAHPGDVMNVTVSRRENGGDFTTTYAVPLVRRESSGWKDRSIE